MYPSSTGGIRKNFLLLLVAGGKESDQLKDLVAKYKLTNKTIFLGFVPPWKIPSIIKASTCVVHAEHDFPIKTHYPIVPREVMAVGRCLVLSEELYEKRKLEKIKDGVNVLVVNPRDIKSFRKILAKVINNPAYALEIGKKARRVSKEREDFEGYITQTENLYRKVLKGS